MKERKEDIYHLHGKNRTYVHGDITGEYSAGDLDTGFRHSTHYHQYFEGYTEVRLKNTKDKYVIKRYYTLPWIVSDETNSAQRQRKMLYWILYFSSVLLFVWCTTWRIKSNLSYWVAAPGFATVIFSFCLFFSLLRYSFRPKRMTLYEFKSNTRKVRYLSLLSGIAMELSMIMVGVVLIIEAGDDSQSMFLQMIVLQAGALEMIGVHILETKAGYVEKENLTEIPNGGFVIK